MKRRWLDRTLAALRRPLAPEEPSSPMTIRDWLIVGGMFVVSLMGLVALVVWAIQQTRY